MEILTIFYILALNCIAIDSYDRVARAATCPNVTKDEFPGTVSRRKKKKGYKFTCPSNFTRVGAKFATCQSDGKWSKGPPLCTKTGCAPLNHSQVTNLYMEDVKPKTVVRFSCLESYILIGDTLTYCNGTKWNATLPKCAALHELTECDFEEDLCGWTQDDNEEQDWIRNVGDTDTGSTGPQHDHTLGETGNGHYLYFETSNPTKTGDRANLLSPVYTKDFSTMCFDFWYHIFGRDDKGHVGSLEVFVLDQSQYIDDDDVHPLLNIDGNKGDQWHRGQIVIDKQDKPYQIAIVATRGSTYIGDIAIDDVRLHNCTKSTTAPSITQTMMEKASEAQPLTKPTTNEKSITKTTEKTRVSDGRSQNTEDDTLEPLIIGFCAGIVASVNIIVVMAFVCLRRRKSYTSQPEDELLPISDLKPIMNMEPIMSLKTVMNPASLQSLNNGQFNQVKEQESESGVMV